MKTQFSHDDDMREKALAKMKLELGKDIEYAVELAQQCGLMELFYYIFQLRILRILPSSSMVEEGRQEMVNMYSNVIEESFKYIISLVIKCGTGKLHKEDGRPFLHLGLVTELLKHTNYINSKFETISFVKMFPIQVSGERYQHVRIDISQFGGGGELSPYLDYFTRLESDYSIFENSFLTQEIMLENFREAYLPVAEIFNTEFGISVNEFITFISGILNELSDRFKAIVDELPRLDNGRVDIHSGSTMMALIKCMIFNEQTLEASYESKYHLLIDRLTFNPETFDEHELKFHSLTRTPFIQLSGSYLFSPELVLDSVMMNTHYSILESASKHQYIKNQADAFLTKLATIGGKFGYREVARDTDLKIGKKQIGDIDLTLVDDKGHYLLIEAKNHALPLPVYFKDISSVKDHLSILKKKWESHFKERLDFLKDHHQDVGIASNYTYILVSKYPEIISHFSEHFIISIKEFEKWLSDGMFTNNFKELFHKYYSEGGYKFSEHDLQEMTEAGMIFGKYAKE